jgi:hypothetical protein
MAKRGRGRPKGSKTSPNHKPLPFKLSELQRSIKGVQSMGLTVGRVEIDPRSGKITIVPGVIVTASGDPKTNSWDEVLPNAQNQKRVA